MFNKKYIWHRCNFRRIITCEMSGYSKLLKTVTVTKTSYWEFPQIKQQILMIIREKNNYTFLK